MAVSDATVMLRNKAVNARPLPTYLLRRRHALMAWPHTERMPSGLIVALRVMAAPNSAFTHICCNDDGHFAW